MRKEIAFFFKKNIDGTVLEFESSLGYTRLRLQPWVSMYTRAAGWCISHLGAVLEMDQLNTQTSFSHPFHIDFFLYLFIWNLLKIKLNRMARTSHLCWPRGWVGVAVAQPIQNSNYWFLTFLFCFLLNSSGGPLRGALWTIILTFEHL